MKVIGNDTVSFPLSMYITCTIFTRYSHLFMAWFEQSLSLEWMTRT